MTIIGGFLCRIEFGPFGGLSCRDADWLAAGLS